jgi:hypothetical protein
MRKRRPPIAPGPRDAPELWGGLAYQKIVTLLAWLDIQDDELLFIELGEDYLRTGASDGLAVQVRRTKRPLSLGDTAARKIIQYAFDRQEPYKTVYWSTSAPGCEHGLFTRFNRSGVALPTLRTATRSPSRRFAATSCGAAAGAKR